MMADVPCPDAGDFPELDSPVLVKLTDEHDRAGESISSWKTQRRLDQRALLAQQAFKQPGNLTRERPQLRMTSRTFLPLRGLMRSTTLVALIWTG